ncbi:MAG: hypothetical protein WC143_08220 [Eubacteriales bacterium]
MTHKNRQLLDEYVLRLSDLQYKKRKKQEDFIIIGLFLIAFVEYLSNKKMVELIDKGLNNQGKFVNYVKDMRESNVNIINTTTNIIPQIKEKSESIAKKKLIETIEKTDLYEKQNYLSQFINNTAFNKNYKTWNTQRDNRVRYTTFHQNIDGIEVKINEFFNVDGITAMFPAHSTLPQYDRINCRCYLTYR